MLRRSRISVRPNVRPAGRGPAPGSSQEPSQEAPATDPQDTGDLAKAGSQEGKDPSTLEGTENPSESPTPGDDGKEKSVEASSSAPACSAGSQRRKRYSVMPNLAKPRVTPALTRSTNRTSRSPVKAASETLVPASAPDSEVPGPSDQTSTTVPQGVRSPRRRKTSGGARQPTQAKPTSPGSPDPSPADQSELEEGRPQQGSPSEHLAERQLANPQSDGPSTSQTKDAPPPVLEKATLSLPSREASELSERAKTLVSRSVKCGLSLAPGKSRLSRLLNDPTDLQRLAKARKLRELLKQEMNKERKSKKAKVCAKEYTVDPSKMTMRDLIYYLPDSNPMTSFVEDKRAESEIVIPNSPSREESPERVPEPEKLPEPASQREDEEGGDADEDEGDSDAGQDDQLMVPRVKVAEDGSLIIDEESLTVEVLRAKGPNPMEDRDPIFERGSTTTYSSFRRATYSKPWSSQETDMFYLAISMVGTDFSMIGQLFPHRARIEIKNKFKREERENGWRIDKAFKERRKMDVEFFSNLLEKILAIGKKKKKKPKSPTERKVRKARTSKPKAKKLSDVEEEEEEEGAELEGEKENEGVLNEDGAAGATPKKKRGRSADDGASSPAKSKKKKKGKLFSEDEAGVPEDSEAALPEDESPLESSQKADEPVAAPKGPVIKPAQLSRGRAPRPIPTLGRRWGQKTPAPSTGPRGAMSTAGDKSTEDSTPQEQEVASPSEAQGQRQDARQDTRQTEEVPSSDEEGETTVAPAKPTRYGRIPKPTQHLNYPAKDDGPAPPCDAEGPNAPPRRGKLRPGPSLPQSKGKASPRKPKLVTLRASQSEESEEEGDEPLGEGLPEEEDLHLPTSPAMENQAPVFVPYTLRSPQPVASELEETMEELDISINMPDVLGIPDGALCPDASCERGEGGAGGEVPCEHQLDLLVDVIDFLSPEPMEESEESYNEAARTLLTMSNQKLPSPDSQDCCSETNVLIEEEPRHQPPTDQSHSNTGPPETVTPDPVVSVEQRLPPDPSATTADSVPMRQGSDDPPTQWASTNESGPEPEPPSQAETGSDSSEVAASQTRRIRIPKPKPNLGRTARTGPSKPQLADETLAHLKPVEMPSTLTAPSEARPGEGTAALSPQTTTTASHSEPPQATQRTQHPNQPSCAPPSPESTFPAAPEGATPSKESMASPSVVTETSKATEASETITRPDSVPQTPETNDGPPFQPTEVVSTNQGTVCEVVPAPPEESGSSEQTASQAKRSRFPKLKPKPNLGRATRTTQPKPQLAAETSVQLKPVESSSTVASSSEARPGEKDSEGLPTSTTASEPLPAEDKPSLVPPTDTSTHSAHPDEEHEGQIGPSLLVKPGAQPAVQETANAVGSVSRTESGSDGSDSTVPQPRRTRLPKPKPNLGRASRSAPSKPQPAEETSTATSKSLPAEGVSAPSEPQTGSDTPSNTISSPGSSPCLRPSEDQAGGDLRSGGDLQRSGPPETSAPVLVQHGSTPGEVEGLKQPSCVERETSNVEAQRHPDVDPAPDPPKASRTARLPKLKPSLGCGGQGTLSRSSWSATPSKPGPSVQKSTLGELAAQILDISKPPSRRKAKRPLGGAPRPETTAWARSQIPAEDGSASLFSTAAPVGVIQTPRGEDQSSPVTRTNSEAVPVDLPPSDPEEPFFILSLTEIPVLLTGEEMAPAPLPFLQAPEPACPRAHSSATAVPGGEVTSGSDGVPRNVPEPPVEPEGGESGMVRSEEARTDVCEEPAENQEEEAVPPRKKRKLPDKSGRAKPEVKSTTTRKEQAVHATSARPTSSASPSTQQQEPPPSEPDLAPVPSPASPRPLARTQDSPATAGPVTSQERAPAETRGGAVGPTESSRRQGGAEDGGMSSEAQDVRGITPLAASGPLSRPGRRPRGFLSFMADKSSPSPTGGPRGTKAASRKPQLGTARPGRKAGAPADTSSAPALTSSAPADTSSAPALTSSAPADTSSAPALTSSAPADTSSAPALTSSAPALTSSAPALTSSAPALTSSAPALTSSAPALTSSAQTHTPPAGVEASGLPDVSWACARPEPGVSSQPGPSAFQCSSAAEVEGSQQKEVSSAEEEDISVSQYFFSDIFTEVENEG
ncbi:transcription factor TFIIIB component B'' homolog [Osmerus mordax]|uniref:transcription factor TFIIIB component B'' homolog n=1 Tax=Osmerus mordax TaxID=8014 RepID=UPI00350EDE96